MAAKRSKSKSKAKRGGKVKQPPLISAPEHPTVLASAQGRQKLTKRHLDDFLGALSQGFSVSDACLLIGFSREHMYELRRNDEEFGKLWAAAIELGTAALEDLAIKRARSYSDNLLMFLLKGRDPKYGLPRGGTLRLPGAPGTGGEGDAPTGLVEFTFDFGNDVNPKET